MPDPRVQKLASILVRYSTEVQPGEFVIINGDVNGLPLMVETYREVLLAGGHPNMLITTGQTTELALKYASEEQLSWISPFEKIASEEADVAIVIRASDNTRHLSGTDPERMQIAQRARGELMAVRMERSARGEFKWVLTQYPTNAYAQEADMSLSEYEDFVYGATFADQGDPVAKWLEFSEFQQKLVDWLEGKKEVVVKGPNVDLKLSIEGRKFINSDGHHNMPSGEIFTGPVEDSVNGWVRFTYPAITMGREVEGIELRFENGKVVEAHAEKNEEFLISQLDTDGGSRYLGEFAIGTNNHINRFTKNILFDEKLGGTIHMAVGAGYPETGSRNKSSIHWDMICDMRDGGEIYVDGELFYRSGEFMI